MAEHGRLQGFLDLLAEGGNTGFWSYCPARNQFWADASARGLLDSPGATTLEGFWGAVDGRQREALLAEIERCCALHDALRCTVHVATMGGPSRLLQVRARWQPPQDGQEGCCMGLVELPQTLQGSPTAPLQDLAKGGPMQSDLREVLLLAAFDKAPIAIVLMRLQDGVFVNVNTQFEQLFGYGKEAAIGSTPVALGLWYQSSRGKEILALLKARGLVRNQAVEFRHQSGRIGQLQLSAELVELAGQTMVLGMMVDTSELAEARHRLADSQARYQILADSSADGVAVIKDGVVQEANVQVARLLGLHPGEIVGQPVTRGMRAALAMSLGAYGQVNGSPQRYEHVRPDGTALTLELSSRYLQQGNTHLHIATLRDVTESVERERSLRILQASISHLMDSNVVGMMLVETGGLILEANDYMLQVLGRSREALQRGLLNCRDMTPDTFTQSSARLREQHLLDGYGPAYERPFFHADGSVVHMMVAVARLPDAPDRWLTIALDITAQKQNQAQLLELNAQLERRTLEAERADAAKSLFLSSISHELRTPQHTILGYVRLLRKKSVGDDALQLGIVEQRGAHLLRLIDDLLEFNHTAVAREGLRADFVTMEGFVASLESMFSVQAEQSGNQFSLRLGEVLPVGLVVDEGRLVQVLRILVDNACKYTIDGSIILALECLSPPQREGMCRLLFSVQDSGRGIPSAELAHIFEPLHRGSNAQDRPGLGLGLAIAGQWVQRMGSQIAVRSEEGHGSCFSFELELEACFEQVPRWRQAHSLQPPAKKAPGPSVVPALPPAELATLGQLLGMGRMGRLNTWAHELGARHPELQPMAQQIAGLASRAEVDTLERLYRRWMA